jgi:hypothetical protein
MLSQESKIADGQAKSAACKAREAYLRTSKQREQAQQRSSWCVAAPPS